MGQTPPRRLRGLTGTSATSLTRGVDQRLGAGSDPASSVTQGDILVDPEGVSRRSPCSAELQGLQTISRHRRSVALWRRRGLLSAGPGSVNASALHRAGVRRRATLLGKRLGTFTRMVAGHETSTPLTGVSPTDVNVTLRGQKKARHIGRAWVYPEHVAVFPEFPAITPRPLLTVRGISFLGPNLASGDPEAPPPSWLHEGGAPGAG